MSKYLIIGGGGTLGSEFKKILSDEECVAVNRNQLNISNPNQLSEYFQNQKPEIVINCAAYTDVDGAESDISQALETNSKALLPLSIACNSINAKLVHFSTGMVFEGDNPEGYNEDSIPKPVNKYGESKLCGEQIILNNCNNFYIIRTEWLYGKPQSESSKKSFIELMISLGKSGKVKGVMDEIGKPTWSKDLAKATIDLVNSDNSNGIYHLINEGQASRLDWAREIYNLTNMDVELLPVSGKEFPRAADRPTYELLNNTKLAKLRTWQEALTEYLKS